MLGAALTLAAYLVGSISFGLIEASRRGVDLRAIGSGNVGATNAARALGRAAGRKVLALDLLKGLVPVALARWVFDLSWPWVTAVGVAAVVGHCFPVWHGFRGGKGAATAGGVLLGALPPIGAATLLAWAVAKKVSRRASVASLCAATLGAGLALSRYGTQWPARLAVGLWVLIVVRHASNIGRLLRGEEPPG
ncbi:MAG: glycerol-3-phosphate 1-O-acyltransferase PlsY [Myxococcales bacterium]|jgi:glycerol-3-phosphate acyltransferase PlsY